MHFTKLSFTQHQPVSIRADGDDLLSYTNDGQLSQRGSTITEEELILNHLLSKRSIFHDLLLNEIATQTMVLLDFL